MPLQYDREELYVKVWERPLVNVAQEYGVSAVALGKTCRKLSVPLPGRGHWTKLAHGQAGVRKPQLPKLDKVPVVYRSPRVEQRPGASADQSDPEFAAIDHLLSSGALNPPPLHSADVRPHVLIRRTASLLRNRRRTDEKGILLPRGPGGLSIDATPGTLERALQVMNQVLAVLQGQGIRVEITDKGGTVACINDQRVYFGVEERIRQHVAHKPRVPQPKHSWDYDRIVTYEPTGALTLVIDSDTWHSQPLRRRWSDAKIQRVEKLVPQFVAGLMRTAVALRRQQEELKRRELEAQRRAEEREQLRKEIEAEENKLKQLNEWIDSWERADRLRRFIAVYAEKTSKWLPENQPRYQQWIVWANRQADRLDPFISEKPASILDRKHELRAW